MSNAPLPDESVARALLGGAIDYAGLFPPASLSLAEVVTNYRSYRASDEAWALGRLVLPANRLAEFAGMAPDLAPKGRPASPRDDAPIPVAALIGDNTAEDIAAIDRFTREQNVARVESIEVRADSARVALAIVDEIPSGWPGYFEVPVGPEGDAVLDVVAARGFRAKVRTGGTREDAFPDPAALTHFLLAVEERGVPFKATAGLHHPLRGNFPLTYSGDAPAGTMYGYLNLALAAMLAWTGRAEPAVRAALLESDRSALRVADASLVWKDESFPWEILLTMRTEFYHSFGSCSFREPLEEWPL